MFLCLTVKYTHLNQNNWIIDEAFTVQSGMKNHSGAYMTVGKGMIGRFAKTQTINTIRSTEAEVVAMYKNMPAILWTRYFLEAQGYPLKLPTLHQDNTSMKVLEIKGRAPSSKRTHHMNIRYFFFTDVHRHQHITIKYCPSDEMIGDFSKTLWGEQNSNASTISS